MCHLTTCRPSYFWGSLYVVLLAVNLSGPYRPDRLYRQLFRCGASLKPNGVQLPALYLPVEIPARLPQVLDRVVLQISPPDILDGIAKAEAHMLSDINALDTRLMGGIVRRLVHHVSHHQSPIRAAKSSSLITTRVSLLSSFTKSAKFPSSQPRNCPIKRLRVLHSILRPATTMPEPTIPPAAPDSGTRCASSPSSLSRSTQLLSNLSPF